MLIGFWALEWITSTFGQHAFSRFIWSSGWWVKSWKRLLLSAVITPFRYCTQHWHANSLFSPSNSPQQRPKMNCIHNPNYDKTLPFVSTNSFFLLKILNQVINGSRSRWAGARNSRAKRTFTDWSIFSISFLLWKKGSPVTQWRQISFLWLVMVLPLESHSREIPSKKKLRNSGI